MGLVPDQAVLQKEDHLLGHLVGLVLLDKVVEVVVVDDNVLACGGGQLELAGGDAGDGDFLPGTGVVGLAGSLDGGGVLLEVDQTTGDPSVGFDFGVEDLSGFVQLELEALVSYSLAVGGVGFGDEGVDFLELFELGHREQKFVVDVGVLEAGTGHDEVLDEDLILLLAFSDRDHLVVLGAVLSLQEGVDRLGDHGALDVSLS